MVKKDLKQYLEDLTPAQRERFAKRCDTSLNTLWGVARGYDPSSPQIAVAIDRESGGVVDYRTVSRAYKKRGGRIAKPMDWNYIERKVRAQVAVTGTNVALA